MRNHYLQFASIMLSVPTVSYASSFNSNDSGGAIVMILAWLVGIIVVFLICREILCWYWKINQLVALLNDIRDLLQKIVVKQGIASTSNSKQQDIDDSEVSKPSDTEYVKNLITELDRQSKSDMQETSQQYEDVKFKIVKELKVRLVSNSQFAQIEKYAQLSFPDLINIGRNPQSLTEDSLAIYRLYLESIFEEQD